MDKMLQKWHKAHELWGFCDKEIGCSLNTLQVRSLLTPGYGGDYSRVADVQFKAPMFFSGEPAVQTAFIVSICSAILASAQYTDMCLIWMVFVMLVK